MKRRPALLAVALLCGTAQPAHAESAAGHYFLEGVMETGSELLLRPDGRFQFYLVYGALDLFANGLWTERDGHVLLNSDKPEPGYEAVQAFKTLDLARTTTSEREAALETVSNGRTMLYVRHDRPQSGD